MGEAKRRKATGEPSEGFPPDVPLTERVIKPGTALNRAARRMRAAVEGKLRAKHKETVRRKMLERMRKGGGK